MPPLSAQGRSAMHARLQSDLSDLAQLRSTSLSQVAIFALEYALSQMWKARGVEPFAVLGHSAARHDRNIRLIR